MNLYFGSPTKRAPFSCRYGAAVVRSVLAFVTVVLLSAAVAAQTQSQQSVSVASPQLARDNMSLVAASAAQIKTVLVQDTGLMVELKRWVAQDATNQGQIITESDLTEDSIFQRLENDVHFRAVATALLQRYGYLVPTLNPESEAAKEQDLLVQERVKWITQEEEQAREQQASEAQDRLEMARKCRQGDQSSCPGVQQQQQGQPRLTPFQLQGPSQQVIPGLSPNFGNPNELNPPTMPPGGGNDLLERAQLMQTGSSSDQLLGLSGAGGLDSTDSFAGLSGTSGIGSSAGTAGSESSASSLLQQLQNGDTGNAGLGLSNGEGQLGSLQSSMMAQYLSGMEMAPSIDQTDVNPFDMDVAGRIYGYGATPYGYSNSPYYGYRQPFYRNYQNYQNQATLQPVEMVRHASPYQDIPSLYDMYMQALPRPAEPRRFGISVFENEAQNPDLIPMDLPAGPDYVVGPGDGLAIDLWGSVSRRIYRTVDREGRLSLPEVAPVLVSGKSLADVQQSVQQVLRTQFRDVSADVSLSRLRTVRVYVVGDVANPGAYDISSLSTPLNALFAAGGPTPRGSLRIVRQIRGDQTVQTVDLYDLLLHGVRSDMQRLENGDSVMVPPIGPQVTVEGMVRRPAIYELKDERSLSSVLELAGGLLPTATLRHIEVQRTVAHQKQTMLSLDIPASDDDAAATKKLDSFEIQDGDRIRIFPIAQGTDDAVYLEGYVIRPGRYSYHQGMRVTDLVSSFKDLLPEPSLEYAEIIRLNAPDFHPSVESFDLQEALADPSKAPVLQAMDTVRIFSRFDFENPPSVSVLGDVRGPGTYRTSGQIHVADAVHLAGGLAPDAEVGDAQVFRYLPDGQAKIFSVNLDEALAGDPAANIMLEPRDRLLIHKSPSAEQPATVYIMGEVGKPGRYPLTTNMTVADLIKVGGGLKPSADTQVGDLTHYEWAGQTQLNGQHQPIQISEALSGNPGENQPLHNGDVVSIRQLPNWGDLGATITVRGEVKHPGTYGIRPGERLSSVLERAGGFLPDAYPYGAILQRIQVREVEQKEQDKLILRVKDAEGGLQSMPDQTPPEKQAKEMALGQYQATLLQLTTNAPAGRVPIRISANIDHWKGNVADVNVRAGDTLFIPKRPDYVMVTGQVFNPTAVSYHPGRSAKWYLEQAGGPTATANRKAIFVIRADGSVIGQKDSLWSGSALGATLEPGDTVVVPEKAIGPGIQWQTVFAMSSVAASIVSAIFIATHY
jgi:polysaccharide biosynthesis/export protein